jgi:hypothetical protein
MATKRPRSKKTTDAASEPLSGAPTVDNTAEAATPATPAKRARKTPAKRTKATPSASPEAAAPAASVHAAGPHTDLAPSTPVAATASEAAVPAPVFEVAEIMETEGTEIAEVAGVAPAAPIPQSVPENGRAHAQLPYVTATDIEIQEAIRRRAYQIFEQRGFRDGHDFDDWINAEREVLAYAGR